MVTKAIPQSGNKKNRVIIPLHSYVLKPKWVNKIDTPQLRRTIAMSFGVSEQAIAKQIKSESPNLAHINVLMIIQSSFKVKDIMSLLQKRA
jgi:hypothetical protein